MLEDIELEEVEDGVYAPVSDRPKPQSKSKKKTSEKKKSKPRITRPRVVIEQPVMKIRRMPFTEIRGQEAVHQFMEGFNTVVRIIGGIKCR